MNKVLKPSVTGTAIGQLEKVWNMIPLLVTGTCVPFSTERVEGEKPPLALPEKNCVVLPLRRRNSKSYHVPSFQFFPLQRRETRKKS
jgi:hypothetical protein